MCGIAGILTAGELDPAVRSVERMVAAAHHRGPDASAVHTIPVAAGHLVLGHNRLAVIDLTPESNQPMIDEETGSYLCYNGEIYNFQELRQELKSQGCRFRTRGDTETLLKALVHWGAAALPKLRGMFAFAFWDGLRRELLLARDPLGVKPLYFSRSGNSIIFGSEVKVIQASRFAQFTLNPSAVGAFLVYGAVIRPDTIIREISEVTPGHVLTISENGHVASSKEYWSLKGEVHKNGHNGNGIVECVSHLLRRAIQRHLVSDVETAVALSGGLDSSLIALLAAQAKANIRLLTIIFPEKAYSEQVAATETARHAGAPHEVVTLTGEDLLRQVPTAIAAMDQPTADGVNTLVVSMVAATLGIKVLLSGLGGDEIFGGYTTFRKLPFLTSYPGLFRNAAHIWQRLGFRAMPQFNKLEQLQSSPDLREVYLLQRSIRWKGARGGLGTDECPPNDYAVPTDVWNELGSRVGSDSFHCIAGFELQFYMLNQLLRDADVFSMATSTEMRIPLLDLDLVTAALHLPRKEHLNNSEGKRLERRILSEACPQLRLPKQKRGFTFPWNEWLRGPLMSSVKETILDRRFHAELNIDSSDCEHTVNEFFSGNTLIPWQQIWSLFVLFRWMDRNYAT